MTAEKSHREDRMTNENICEDNRKTVKQGKEHWNFKNSFNYKTLHKYMKERIIKPKLCEACKKNKPIDLAFRNHQARYNTPELYTRDIADWYYLCRKCHMNKDGRIKNLKQYNGK